MSVKKSSGNVFEDLELKDSGTLLAKAELARKIAQIVAKQGLTQKQVAKILGVDQPKVSALLRGHLSGYSTERLMRFLNAMGRDVEIVIKKRTRKSTGRISVVAQ